MTATTAYDRAFASTIDKIKRMPPGAQFVYFTGCLAEAAEPNRLADGTAKPTKITGIKQGAWQAYMDGLCVLAQRRITEGVCEYIAFRSR